MKNLQNVVDHFESDRKKHRRYVAVLSAMSLLISFAVPYSLINPASSITTDDSLAVQMLSYANIADNKVTNVSRTDGNGGISKAETSEKALLIGVPTVGNTEDRDWLASLGENPSAEQIITAAQNKYFLGIASDFCIFLEDHLTVKDSDAEGRVAVGGNVEFTNAWNYQIGSGDFATSTALGSTDNYVGITDFAHLICTGTITNINPYGNSDKNDPDKIDAMKNYKNLVIGSESGSTHYNGEGGWSSGKKYKNGCDCDNVTKDELSQLYEASLINFSDAFEFIRNQSTKLSKIGATGTVQPLDAEHAKVTNWHGESGNDSVTDSTGMALPSETLSDGLLLTGPGKDSGAKIVYFTINNWEDMHGKALVFEEIPEYIDENGKKQIANIVINVAGENITVLDDTRNKANIVFTFINGEEISNTGPKASNNHKWSENILYNFYEAESLFIDGNFNGTVLAPNADVKSDDGCQGHLSGSLIAKSFEGGLEFGYRPYRGTKDILGSGLGYSLPFEKFIEVENGEYLAGATFKIVETSPEQKSAGGFTSENGLTFADFESKIKFDGSVTYDESNNTASTIYEVSEEFAPEGFIKDSESNYYQIQIDETVCLGNCDVCESEPLAVDGGNIPTHVTSLITIRKIQNGAVFSTETLNIDLQDIYSYESGSDKQVMRRLAYGDQVIWLQVTDGVITGIEDGSGSVVQREAYTVNKKTSEKDWFEKSVAVETEYREINEGDTLDSVQKAVEDEYPKETENVKKEELTGVTVEQVEKNLLEDYESYTIAKLAWSSGQWNNAKINKVEFYHTDGSITTLENPEFNGDSEWWLQCSNYGTEEKDVIGLNIVVDSTSSANMAGFVIQGEGEKSLFTNTTGENPKTDLKSGDNRFGYPLSTEDISEDGTAFEVPVEDRWKITKEVKTSVWDCVPEPKNYDQYESIGTNGNLKEKQQILDNGYYYNPDSLMVMPIPVNVPSFVNDRGLIFSKIDKDSQNRIPGAYVVCYPCDANGEIIGDGIEILDGKREEVKTINLGELPGSTGCWCFVEEAAPDDYETTTPIYLRHTADDVWECSKDLTNWTVIDLTTSGIVMEDIKISGAVIQLEKWNADFTRQLAGAKFELYREDGDPDILVYPTDGASYITIESDTEALNLYDLFKANSELCDGEWIENGYLKPGVYYLKEEKAATGYDKYEGNFTFRIKNDYSVEIVPNGTTNKGDPEDMYLQTAGDGNALLIITGKMLELIKANPDEIFVENLGKVNQIHVSKDGNNWGYTVDNVNLNACTFNEILNHINKNDPQGCTADNIKYIRFMRWDDNKRPFSDVTSQFYDGAPAGSSSSGSSSGASYLTKNEKQDIIVESSLIKELDPDVPFITFKAINDNGWGSGGQIKVNGVYTSNNLYKLNANGNQYTLAEIAELSGTAVKDMNSIEFLIWNIDFSDVQFPALDEAIKNSTSGGDDDSGNTGSGTPDNTGDVLNAQMKTGEGVTGNIIQIPNKAAGDKIKVGVEKKWAKDADFETLRSQEVTVKLHRRNPGENGAEDTTFVANPATITLNEANNWKSDGWAGLEKEKSEGEFWVYYVTEETSNTKYSATYSDAVSGGSGSITITNTLNTIQIDVEKKWKPEGTADLPDSITVNLQYSKDNGKTWDVLRSMELTAPDWNGTFENLYYNYQYKVVESEISGWTASYSSNQTVTNHENATVTITNTRQTGSLEVEKDWDNNDSTNKRPDKITVDIYRSTTPPANSASAISAYSADGESDQYENYAKLLQYSLYFYDANMCGEQVGETSKVSWRNDCHTYSSVQGGFHDAGDHSMFGLPQGFSASSLGWSYYEFNDAYNKLGQTKHYQTIMKYFCDFFVESTKLDNNGNVTDFLYQKGNTGNQSRWDKPETEEQDKFGSELWTSQTGNKASNIAAQYAAALAQYAINFPNDTDKDYLGVAKALYTFSTTYNETFSEQYQDKECTSDQAWAAAWLYLATKEETYKNDCRDKILNASIKDDRGYFYADVTPAVICVYKSHIDSGYDWSTLKIYLDKWTAYNDYVALNSWGSARHNVLFQQVALSATKNIDGADYKDWCKTQMSYILGNNDKNICLVTGFANNSTTSPHHRAASNYVINDWDVDWNCKSSISYADISGSHVLVGALAGGPTGSGNKFSSYKDDMKDAESNEVAMDYNVGLTASAAGLYSFYGTGKLDSKENLTALLGGVRDAYDSTPVVKAKTPQYSTEFDVTQYLNDENPDNDDTTPIFKMNIKDKATLVVKDADGNYCENVAWSFKSAEGEKADDSKKSVSDIVTLDEYGTYTYLNGNVIAESDGIVTGTAFIPNDSSDAATFDVKNEATGTSITFQIRVNLSAANPEIPGIDKDIEGTSKKVGTLTLNEKIDWKASLSDLSLCDANGNTYYYYVVENMTSTDGKSVEGNGAVYYPISYNGNGLSLTAGTAENTIVVTNKTDTTNEGITMPSAGGTGTDGYKTAGLILIGAAVMGYTTVYRKKKRTA